MWKTYLRFHQANPVAHGHWLSLITQTMNWAMVVQNRNKATKVWDKSQLLRLSKMRCLWWSHQCDAGSSAYKTLRCRLSLQEKHWQGGNESPFRVAFPSHVSNNHTSITVCVAIISITTSGASHIPPILRVSVCSTGRIDHCWTSGNPQCEKCFFHLVSLVCWCFSMESAKNWRNHLVPPSRLNSFHSLRVALTAMVLPLFVISVLGLGIEAWLCSV